MLFIISLFIAMSVGVLIGWAWKPGWINFGRDELYASGKKSDKKVESRISDTDGLNESNSANLGHNFTLRQNAIMEDELENLLKLIEKKDGGPPWIQMMTVSTPSMSYKAWRRDSLTGPPQYCSRTVFEDAPPELVRDFFWDDEFRLKWDDMLTCAEVLSECATSGYMVVRWVRKFPFYCSDREYIIGRQIWEASRAYYCVTKGVPCSLPRREKPMRVDTYYSSWCIRAVESLRLSGPPHACEVLLFHHEDMGIPWEIAKLGVRLGMRGAVKKIETSFRMYRQHRAVSCHLSRHAIMAAKNKKMDGKCLARPVDEGQEIGLEMAQKHAWPGLSRILVVRGALALACSLDQSLFVKAVVFGLARRFTDQGKSR